jgi:hypothetical protein
VKILNDRFLSADSGRLIIVKPEQSILNNQFTMLDCEMIASLFVIELFALIAGFAGLIDTELFEDAFIDL